jgi:hypothetical protein
MAFEWSALRQLAACETDLKGVASRSEIAVEPVWAWLLPQVSVLEAAEGGISHETATSMPKVEGNEHWLSCVPKLWGLTPQVIDLLVEVTGFGTCDTYVPNTRRIE